MLAIWRADNSSDWESGVGGTGEGGGCGSGSYWDDEFANGATGGTGAGTAAAGGSGGFGTGGTGGSIDYGTGGAGYTPSTAGSSGGPPVPGAGGTGSGTGGGSAGGGQAGAPSGGGSAGHGTGGSSWEFPEDPENQVRITWGNSARTCSESWNDGCGNANAELTISRDQLHPGVIIDLEQTNAFMSASGVNLDGTGPDDCWFGGGTLWGTLEVLEVTEGTLRFRVEGTNWEEPSLDGDFTAYWCN